jgi:hypothetical protein
MKSIRPRGVLSLCCEEFTYSVSAFIRHADFSAVPCDRPGIVVTPEMPSVKRKIAD